MKRLRVLLAFAAMAVAASACGSDPVAAPDPGVGQPRHQVQATSPSGNDPVSPCNPESPSTTVCQVMGSGG